MTDDETALARRAVACKVWRWMSGMLAVDTSPDSPRPPQRLGQKFSQPADGREWLPDLSDPATLGCIEHGLLPEAWGGRIYGTPVLMSRGIGWIVIDAGGPFIPNEGLGEGPDIATALVAALEAAP